MRTKQHHTPTPPEQAAPKPRVFDFDPDTAEGVKRALIAAYHANQNIRIWLGDPLTGQAWLEEFEVRGHVGRSTGVIKAPLLLAQQRSTGGGTILTRNVLRVDLTNGKKLYQHPQFKHGLEGHRVVAHKLPQRTFVDVPSAGVGGWETVAVFDTEQGARNWIGFMTGQRYSK